MGGNRPKTWRDVFRWLFSPRTGAYGSAASSVPPPGHTPIGIETNAVWSDGSVRGPQDDRPEWPDESHRQNTPTASSE